MFEKLKAKKLMKLISDPEVLEELSKIYSSPKVDELVEEQEKYQKRVEKIQKKKANKLYDVSKLFIGYIGHYDMVYSDFHTFRMDFTKSRLAILSKVPTRELKKYPVYNKYKSSADNFYKAIFENGDVYPCINEYVSYTVASVAAVKPLSQFIDIKKKPFLTESELLELPTLILKKEQGIEETNESLEDENN